MYVQRALHSKGQYIAATATRNKINLHKASLSPFISQPVHIRLAGRRMIFFSTIKVSRLEWLLVKTKSLFKTQSNI